MYNKYRYYKKKKKNHGLLVCLKRTTLDCAIFISLHKYITTAKNTTEFTVGSSLWPFGNG